MFLLLQYIGNNYLNICLIDKTIISQAQKSKQKSFRDLVTIRATSSDHPCSELIKCTGNITIIGSEPIGANLEMKFCLALDLHFGTIASAT